MLEGSDNVDGDNNSNYNNDNKMVTMMMTVTVTMTTMTARMTLMYYYDISVFTNFVTIIISTYSISGHNA